MVPWLRMFGDIHILSFSFGGLYYFIFADRFSATLVPC